jgi:hypothetical protein
VFSRVALSNSNCASSTSIMAVAISASLASLASSANLRAAALASKSFLA